MKSTKFLVYLSERFVIPLVIKRNIAFERQAMTKMNLLHIGTMALLLGACGSAGDISQRNPNYLGAILKDGVISGSYNPAGFAPETVQAQIKTICVNEKLGSYQQGAGSNGLVTFKASCAQGSTLRRAFVEIERMPNGNFSVEIIGS